MTDSNAWTEQDSRSYRELAAVAVPHRQEQLAVLVSLVPFAEHEPFRIVELGCGEGRLGAALLSAFPRADYLGFDGSESMRVRAVDRLRRFGSRARVEPFALEAAEWRPAADGAGLVVSSLCVHHLSGAAKRDLFLVLCGSLAERGALLLADLVAPVRPEAAGLFAATLDLAAEAQARACGDDSLYCAFVETRWNWYRHPDPADQPSPLFDQLIWLKEAGFAVVDCFWMNAGHAVYGGYKSGVQAAAGLSEDRFERALRAARDALSA